MTRIKLLGFLLLIGVAFSCRDRYEPGLESSSEFYLVVEGVLNAGSGPTDIRLSRTFKLEDTARLQMENNAFVTVEGKDNTTRQLTMNGDGIYSSPDLGLLLGQEYRLRIVTANGKEYLSDYVIAKKTPIIDSVSYRQNDKGLQIFVTTHDNTNNTRYYLWSYDETWELRTYYYSKFKYVNDTLYERDLNDDVSTCWKYNSSTSIVIGTSASFQTDTIPEAPLIFIGNGDEKLAVRYSILVKQVALDKEGYEFYEMMKKNTESLGTIFDAQPSEIKGNIHSVSDPNEPVIGYISATTIEEKRIFIQSWDLDPRWRFIQYCPSDTVPNHPDSIRYVENGGYDIYDALFPPTAYLYSFPVCVDCTARGGLLTRPPYW